MTSKVEVLSDICTFADGRVAVSDLNLDSYISTENMLPNKEGITKSAGMPTISQTQAYKMHDVLISNIRPYFKKIWFADRNGGCSNDVLVMRAKDNCDPNFLYYLLADDKFFDYATGTSKGTKMPRGDRSAIMKYEVPDIPMDTQIEISRTLRALDDKIANNTKINRHLEQMAQAIFKSWFVDFEPWGGVMPEDWREYHLGDFFPVVTGKMNANVSSNIGRYPFFSCAQTVAWTNQYSFEGKAILVAGNGDFNVKWYDGKFEAYQRTYVLMPYDGRLLAFLYYATCDGLNKITSAARGSVIRFITKGNLENYSFVAPKNLVELPVVATLQVINTQIAQNTEESARLATLRDTLLPRLMSGELSVANIQE